LAIIQEYYNKKAQFEEDIKRDGADKKLNSIGRINHLSKRSIQKSVAFIEELQGGNAQNLGEGKLNSSLIVRGVSLISSKVIIFRRKP
jgi:hypothetical protein